MDWHLSDGEKLHAEHPDTFGLPDAAERENLVPGQFAKLIFTGPSRLDNYTVPATERMWVEVSEADDGRYVGKLNNDPFMLACIADGDRVEFEPRHVIQILGPAPA